MGARLQLAVVSRSGELRPADPADLAAAGRSPSPLAGRSVGDREVFLLGLLEARALAGCLDSAKAWLQHRRWRFEMRRGKAPTRASLQVTGRITVTDDLGKQAAQVVDVSPAVQQIAQAAGDGGAE